MILNDTDAIDQLKRVVAWAKSKRPNIQIEDDEDRGFMQGYHAAWYDVRFLLGLDNASPCNRMQEFIDAAGSTDG